MKDGWLFSTFASTVHFFFYFVIPFFLSPFENGFLLLVLVTHVFST
jgi:hypothetical protein